MKTLLVMLMASLALPAAAAETPLYLPNRDAAIVYHSTGSDPMLPESLTIRYSAAADRLRIEGGPIGYLLVDRGRERVELVMAQPHLVVQLPPGAGITQGFILSNRLAFRRTGSATVLGRACTLYDVSAERAHGSVCLTADGLLLRGEGQGRDGRTARIEAVSVAFAAQPAGLFAPPDGYQVMALPK